MRRAFHGGGGWGEEHKRFVRFFLASHPPTPAPCCNMWKGGGLGGVLSIYICMF